MRYRFDRFALDTELYSLRAEGAEIHVEPLVFDLLRFLIEREGQVATRESIIAHVWNGRAVSDATVSSCIKSARKALGDTGESQRYIRTVRGRGFQFSAQVASDPGRLAPAMREDKNNKSPDNRRIIERDLNPPSIAVLPLFPLSPDPHLGLLGDALAQDVILELSRLHWLVVIARGSTFKFRGQEIDLAQAGEILGADYFLTGTIARNGQQCVVAVELCRASGSNVIWAERYVCLIDEIIPMHSTLAVEIAAALEPRIQQTEAVLAAKLPTEQLDAWSAYHRGLWHMYRFNAHDNKLAAGLFAHATSLDPKFTRAFAGLSFTHFQNAFLGFSGDIEIDKRLAGMHASRSMELDPFDPFANLTMGRSEWLVGNLESGLAWMERSIALCPNYAFAIYNSALVGTLLGDGESNEIKVAKAITLSPIDPLNYAMLATRALTHLIRGSYESALEWANLAVRSPNAHVQIYTIAAFTNELFGNRAKANEYVKQIRKAYPGYRKGDFLNAFPFRDDVVRKQVERALDRLGL